MALVEIQSGSSGKYKVAVVENTKWQQWKYKVAAVENTKWQQWVDLCGLGIGGWVYEMESSTLGSGVVWGPWGCKLLLWKAHILVERGGAVTTLRNI